MRHPFKLFQTHTSSATSSSASQQFGSFQLNQTRNVRRQRALPEKGPTQVATSIQSRILRRRVDATMANLAMQNRHRNPEMYRPYFSPPGSDAMRQVMQSQQYLFHRTNSPPHLLNVPQFQNHLNGQLAEYVIGRLEPGPPPLDRVGWHNVGPTNASDRSDQLPVGPC